LPTLTLSVFFFTTDTVVFCQILFKILNGYPQPAAGHFTVAFQLGNDAVCQANGNGKPDALTAGNDRGVDDRKMTKMLTFDRAPLTIRYTAYIWPGSLIFCSIGC
jgi:hypothetical protein